MLEKEENVLFAWAEECTGIGWTNNPVWVLTRKRDGSLRVFSIQPSEQTQRLLDLSGVSSAVNEAMVSAVNQCLAIQRLAK